MQQTFINMKNEKNEEKLSSDLLFNRKHFLKIPLPNSDVVDVSYSGFSVTLFLSERIFL